MAMVLESRHHHHHRHPHALTCTRTHMHTWAYAHSTSLNRFCWGLCQPYPSLDSCPNIPASPIIPSGTVLLDHGSCRTAGPTSYISAPSNSLCIPAPNKISSIYLGRASAQKPSRIKEIEPPQPGIQGLPLADPPCTVSMILNVPFAQIPLYQTEPLTAASAPYTVRPLKP